jgi:hypothetical protein
MKLNRFLALALSAGLLFSACNKEDAGGLGDYNPVKSVSISIANVSQTTKAPLAGGNTAAVPGNELACTNASDLKVLFADNNGTVVTTKNFTDASSETVNGVTTYSFHNISERVTQVAVVGNVSTNFASLKSAYDAWKAEDENTVKSSYKDIVVFSGKYRTYSGSGWSQQLNQLPEGTYGVALASIGSCEDNGKTYPLYGASVEVAPYKARIEISSVSCTDLGNKYVSAALNSLHLIGQQGVAPADGYVYEFTDNDILTTTVKTIAADNSQTADVTEAWSWNIVPQSASNMVLSFDVEGNGYTPAVPGKTATVVKYFNSDGSEIANFEAGNVYRLKYHFLESNIDPTDTQICVAVDVTIAKWVINDINIQFATN